MQQRCIESLFDLGKDQAIAINLFDVTYTGPRLGDNVSLHGKRRHKVASLIRTVSWAKTKTFVHTGREVCVRIRKHF